MRSTRHYGYIVFALLILCLIYLIDQGSIGNAISNLQNSRKERMGSCAFPGWDGVRNLMVFGDSYSTVRYDPQGDIPSDMNPFGNPPAPYYSGTSCNGPNWINFLTTYYNKSVIHTLDVAAGGAVVDQDLVEQLKGIWSFKQQVEFFLKHYTQRNTKLKWKAETTLFIAFFGINDVFNSYRLDRPVDDVYKEIMIVYASLIDKLYEAGARNFLIMNVPPLERSPLANLGTNKGTGRVLRDAVKTYNRRLERAITAAPNRLPGTYFHQFDTFSMWDMAMVNPKNNPITAPYKELVHCCPEHFRTTGGMYATHPNCKYSVDQYFWLDLLHPTFRIHNATAESVRNFVTRSCRKNGNTW